VDYLVLCFPIKLKNKQELPEQVKAQVLLVGRLILTCTLEKLSASSYCRLVH